MTTLILVYAHEEKELDYKMDLNRSIRFQRTRDNTERLQILTTVSPRSLSSFCPGNWWIKKSATRYLGTR